MPPFEGSAFKVQGAVRAKALRKTMPTLLRPSRPARAAGVEVGGDQRGLELGVSCSFWALQVHAISWIIMEGVSAEWPLIGEEEFTEHRAGRSRDVNRR